MGIDPELLRPRHSIERPEIGEMILGEICNSIGLLKWDGEGWADYEGPCAYRSPNSVRWWIPVKPLVDFILARLEMTFDEKLFAWRQCYDIAQPKQLERIESTPFRMVLFFTDKTTITIQPNGFTSPISLSAAIESKDGKQVSLRISPEEKPNA